MADKMALSVYKTLCDLLDSNNYRYTKNEDKLSVDIVMHGEDIPMDFTLKIDEKRSLIIFTSVLPFKFSEEQRINGAIAVCNINYYLADGSFDFDVRDGETSFKITSSYRNSLVSSDLLQYMFYIACGTLDKYNDRLMLVSKGKLDPNGIIEKDTSCSG